MNILVEALTGARGTLVYFITAGVLAFIVANILIKILHYVYAHIYTYKKALHLRFMERIIQLVIVVSAALCVLFGHVGTEKLWETVFGSTVVIGSVVGIAAQDVMKDAMAGLIISTTRPFEIGDRIFIPQVPRACIVEDITIRHVVLRAKDGMRFIVPNTEMNKLTVQHTNWDHGNRASYLQIGVAHDTDISKASRVIRKAIRECPFTCPNNWNNKDLNGYGDVYVVEINHTTIRLEMTIWSRPNTDNDLAVSEAYKAVAAALAREGIEVPHEFMHLVERQEVPRYFYNQEAHPYRPNVSTSTDMIVVNGDQDQDKVVTNVVGEASKFAAYYGLSPKDTSTVELLSEETLNFVNSVIGEINGRFWIVGNRKKMSIHLRSKSNLNVHQKATLVEIANKKANSPMYALMSRFLDRISKEGEEDGVSFSLRDQKSEEYMDGLEKTLIMKLADDVLVSIWRDTVEVVVKKDLDVE